ncbi:MAG: carboxylesterase family protein, partial [Woeseiaceae bacterium]
MDPSSASKQKNRSRLRSWLWYAVVAVALLVDLAIILLVVGVLRDPTRSLHGMLGAFPWSTLGPHFVLVSTLTLLLALIARKRRAARALTAATIGFALATTEASLFITGSIVAAAHKAGGSVNPFGALWLGSMTAAEPDETVTVGEWGGAPIQAAIYEPAAADRPAPVIVYIHGGGFRIGSFLGNSSDMRWLANRGWLVISIGYRLWTDEEPTWNKAPADVACGLAWTHANASKYGGDASRIALLGDSAGGNLAINYGYVYVAQVAMGHSDT